MSGRIMIVEDERIVALDLRQTLESFGHEVVMVASSGEQAVADGPLLKPDLVLMDIHLDGPMDGTQAACILQQHNIPVLFLTAFAGQAMLDQAEQSSPYGYLVKPVETRALQATVRMALARRRAEIAVEKGEERLRLAVDVAGLGVWEWDAAAARFIGEGQFESIVGHIPESLDDTDSGFLSRIDAAYRPAIAEALTRGEAIRTTVKLKEMPGQGRNGWVDFHARAFARPGGDLDRAVGVIRDVTAQREQEERLRRAAVVFTSTGEGIAILDAQRRVISVNPAFTTLTGFAESDVQGREPDDFLYARRREDAFYTRLRESESDYWSGEVACVRHDGTMFPAWQHLCVVRDAQGHIGNYVLAMSDTGALRRAEAQINHLAYHDTLTGLGNRNMLEDAIEKEIERAHQNGSRVAVLFIDLDGFKLINDTMGHATGDQLLTEVAQRISRVLRRTDTAIRLGGDEFVVVVPEVARFEDCASLAEKLLCEIRTVVELERERISVSASIGIAVYPDNATDFTGLIQAADSAMYGAKERGRNRFAFYSSDMADRAMERLHIEQGLLRAIAGDQLLLQYQPVVRIDDGQLVGFEALIRWDEPSHGRIGPDRFIPVAEECGLIDYIGSWVLHTACAQALRWMRQGFADLRLAVNVSARQMTTGDFHDTVRDALAVTGFPANQLELEITESTLQAVEHSRELLGRLKALGVLISIDDFGTGFSSLSLLKHLPIDRIKIDRSFVQDLPGDPNDVAVTGAIIALATSLGLGLIAEGVETPAQQQFLRARGCTEAQGYLFSRPLDVDDVDQLIATPRGRLS
ncbi:two-component system response regulator [Denitromonas iodatirespirans]|uniref:EAL domain-containing protein n=1 Tax=Denitromonas iodatirespirans TaxID=2795389 RepID=A0A944DB07_DENI1|nr:EAL domain-containing protein [Denitromonas iodatirespirans]MBT0962022.1 EAL domain-containing protein [Denitromonas iodatirespirans]